MNHFFVHSLFRACSTYFYKILSSDNNSVCFQEALHEFVFKNKSDPLALTTGLDIDLQKKLRHPTVSYYSTLANCWPSWSDYIDDKSPVEYYFSGISEECGSQYFSSIIKATNQSCIFCETRTSGRIGALKNSIKNTSHIYLFRNPWDQWLSYFVDDYFFDYNIRVYNESRQGVRLLALKKIFRENDLEVSSAKGSYALFYFFWCSGLMEALRYCDFWINVNKLSVSDDYRREIENQFSQLEISSLDFSSCEVPFRKYGTHDYSFFSSAESLVYDALSISGCSDLLLDEIKSYAKSTFLGHPCPSEKPDLTPIPGQHDRALLVQSLDKVKTLSSNVIALEETLEASCEKQKLLENQLLNQKSDGEIFISEIDRLRGENKFLTDQIAGKSSELDQISGDKNDLDLSLVKAKVHIKDLEERLFSVGELHDSVETDLSSERKNREIFVAEIERLRNVEKGFSERILHVEGVRDLLATEKSDLQALVEELKEQLSTVGDDLAGELTTGKASMDKLIWYEKHTTDLSEKLSASLNDKENAQQELEKLKQQLETMGGELQKVIQERDARAKDQEESLLTVQEFRKHLEAKEGELQKVIQERDERSKENGEVHQLIEVLKEQMEAKEGELQKVIQERDEQAKENGEIQQQLEELQKQSEQTSALLADQESAVKDASEVAEFTLLQLHLVQEQSETIFLADQEKATQLLELRKELEAKGVDLLKVVGERDAQAKEKVKSYKLVEQLRVQLELKTSELKKQFEMDSVLLAEQNCAAKGASEEAELTFLQLYHVQEEIEQYLFQSRSQGDLLRKHHTQQQRIKQLMSRMLVSN